MARVRERTLKLAGVRSKSLNDNPNLLRNASTSGRTSSLLIPSTKGCRLRTRLVINFSISYILNYLTEKEHGERAKVFGLLRVDSLMGHSDLHSQISKTVDSSYLHQMLFEF